MPDANEHLADLVGRLGEPSLSFARAWVWRRRSWIVVATPRAGWSLGLTRWTAWYERRVSPAFAFVGRSTEITLPFVMIGWRRGA